MALGILAQDGVAAAVLAQGLYSAAGTHLHTQPGKVAFQQGQHVCGLVGVGVHPPGLIGAGVQAQRREPFQRRGGIHRGQQGPQGSGVSGEILLRCNAGVVQIAAAVAGGQQLFAAPGVAVQHCHPHCPCRGRLGGGQCGGKARCTAAQYHDLLHKSTPSEIHTFYYNIHSSKRIEECPKFAANNLWRKP